MITNNILSKISEEITKNSKKIIEIHKLKSFIQEITEDSFSDQKFYKILYNLKCKWMLISLKKDIFYIKNPKKNITEYELENTFYRKLLKQHCKQYCNHERYIWGLNALEINYNHFIEPPEQITIINKKKQAKEIIIFQKEILFKKYEVKKKSIFTPLFENTNKFSTSWGVINYANLELSILETLYNIDKNNSPYIENLIIKLLKKNIKQYNFQNLENILQLRKFNSAVNYLLKLTTPLFPTFTETLKQIIKKHGYLL